jgi:hypothetical protein
MSIALMSGLWLGVVFSLSDWLDATSVATLPIALLLAGGLGALGLAIGVRPAAVVLVLFWAAALGIHLVRADGDVVPAIGAPLMLTAAAVALFRTPRLVAIARSVPLMLPVALTILVIPLFTDDLWEAADALHPGNVVLVGGLTVLPLLVVVQRRLRAEVEPIVARARGQIDPTAERRLQDILVKLLPDEEREQARGDVNRLLHRWFKKANFDEAAEALVLPLRRQLWRRAFVVAVGLVAVSTIYMGALAWAMIPIAVADDWAGSAIEVATVDVLWLDFDVPLGVYIVVSTLLGTLASAVLLASVAVDQEYANQLATALLEQPTTDAAMASGPYLAMRKQRPPTK